MRLRLSLHQALVVSADWCRVVHTLHGGGLTIDALEQESK
jgi:hypothetical protein